MKQTNNAIKFLMAQYRAIFKNAYFKGMATALVLTAGLAAGQAQATASEDDYWYKFTDESSTVTVNNTMTSYPSDGVLKAGNAAGAVESDSVAAGSDPIATDGEFDGIISGANLTVGTSGANTPTDVANVKSGNAYGAYLKFTGTNNSSILAEYNHLYLKSGAQISGAAIGAYVNNANGQATATNNSLEIDSGSLSFGKTASSMNAAVRVFAPNGTATATDNQLIVKEGAELNLNSTMWLAGATATGLQANVTDNTLEIQNKSTDAHTDIKGSSLGLVTGGIAYSNDGNESDSFRVINNTLTGDHVTISGTAMQVLGGLALNSTGSVAGAFRAEGNSVDLTDVEISGSDRVQVVGNMVDVTKKDGTVTNRNVFANGVDGVLSLNIVDGTITGKDTDKDDSYITKGLVAGGYATTDAGSATANQNAVVITKTAITDAGIYGGAAVASGADVTAQASYNALTLTDLTLTDSVRIGEDKDKDKTALNIAGGYVKVQGTSLDKQRIEANNNIVTLQAGREENSASTVTGNVYGALVDVGTQKTDTAGATINASNNKVVIGEKTTVTGNVYGAWSKENATMTGNSVEINGRVVATTQYDNPDNSELVSPVIAAAYAGKGNDKNLSVLTGNSITIGQTAEINGVDLYAVAVDPDASGSVTVTGNKVTVAGKVTDSSITGGQGADSVIDLTANSLYTVSASSTGETLASDKIELNGNIINRSNLTLRGYNSDGNNSGSTYNSNLTNLNAGAALYNAGTVFVVGSLKVDDGATLMAINPGATISVTGSDDNKPADAEKKAKAHQVGDWGVLTLSQQQLTNYLTADNSHTVVNLPDKNIAYDYAGSVTITNGGTLEFTDDAVVLSDFDYINDATAGKITVDKTPDNGGSILKGNNVTVAHKFADNATTAQAYKDLHAITADGIQIKANTLNLGSSTLTSTQSADIKFDKATARDAINFDAMTTGTGNHGYVLTSNVVADRKFFTQQTVNKAEINTTTPNGEGTITGTVTISGGSLSVDGGIWTSDSNITIDDGSLSVGASGAGTDANGYYVNNGNPASLTLTGVLDISGNTTTPNAKVTVTGKAGADATLDLTGADVKWGAGTVTVSGTTTISAEQFNTDEAKDYYADNSLDGHVGYGKLLLNREDFNEFLNDKVQTKLNIADGGYVHVNGSVTGSYDFDKFGTTPSDGVVAFTGTGTGTYSGILDIDGELNVVEAAEGADNTFDIGHGTIKANIISINTEDKDRDENPEAITLAGGTLEVEQGFSTNSSKFTIAGTDEHAASLVLAAGLENTGTLTMGGTSSVLTIGNNAKLDVKSGTWANDKVDLSVTGAYGQESELGAVVVGNDEVLIKQAQDLSTDENIVYVASLQADNFAGEGSGTVLSVGKQSSATFNTMQLAGDAVVNVDGYLKVEGRNDINDRNDPAYVNAVDGVSSTAGINFEQGATIYVDGVGSTFELGEKATQALVTIDSTVTDATKNKYKVDEVLSDAKIYVSNFGELKINLSADQTLTKADAAYLTTTLLGSNNYNGYLNVGAADLGITFTPDANGNDIVAWDNIKDFANITAGGTTSQDLKYALVTGIASANDRIQGHYGALQVTTGNTSALQVVGPLSLHNAADFGGKFVFRGDYLNGTTTAADIVFAQNASLALENGGEIGSITGYGSYDQDYGVNSVQISAENGATTTVNGSITKIDELIVDGDTTVTDSIAVNYLDLSASLNTTAEKSSVHVNSADISENAVLKTNSFTIGNANGLRDSTRGNNVNVLGTITTGDLTLNENAELDLFGGVVTAKNLTASATSDISVGYDPLSTIVEDDPETIYDDTKAYTGSLEITGQTKLNGAELYVDPVYGDRTALVSLNKLSGWTNASPRFEGGVLDGSVFVGRNSALGIGSDSLATLQSKIARFQNGVSLEDPQANPDGVGAVLYLGNSFTLGAGESLWLTALTSEGVREYYNANNGTLADISSTANLNVLADTVYLGENTAIVVDAGVLENSSAMITLAGTNGTASVIADGGDIYIDGNVRASTYQVFSGAKIKYIDGYDYAVTEDSEKNINVSTINDFLQGVVDEYGKVTLGVAHNGRAIMHGASDPVYESLLAYVRGYNGPEVKQEVTEEQPDEPKVQADHQTPPTTETPVTDLGIQGVEDSRELYSYNDKGEKVYGQYSNYLLQETIATGDGSAAETVARLAVFGGAAQAAISAGASTYDAVSGRMGVGANGANITVADNTQGAALWLAPIYKSSDSDGFDAEGVDYGVDMDLYGVALGADYTLSNGIRFGAMFNVGSGDVDGQGAGSAVSNDFDYYGFAVYGGYSMGALSVVADVSYTVADNDLEGNTSIDKVGASLDSTNLSVGVTGQYQLDFNGTTVTPHAGLRFSRIDLDDYTVDGEDIIADYDADSMNIFSIPVGVTFAKEFTGDAWTVKPSLDLTLTGNFGDDETDGTVHWAGVQNLSTNVSSEVIDNFTYGATLGVAAKTGNFSLGLGVNYTGSSNVDEFGVQANARFVF